MKRGQGREHRSELVVFVLVLGSMAFLLHFGIRGVYGHGEGADQSSQLTNSVSRLRGMAYGPFREGQSPELGVYPTLSEVREDMPLLRVVANGIRTYGCQNLETVVTATQEIGLPLVLGVWLSGNAEDDAAEIECAVEAAGANPHITSLVAGNESVLAGWLTPIEVCAYIEEIRNQVSIPVTTAEPWHLWVDHPELAACADYLLVHIHPYWECQPIEDAVAFVQEKYGLVSALYPGKRVVIGETGWPTAGTGREEICSVSLPAPSLEQQVLFAAGFLNWVRQEGMDYYFFEAFDEPWKCDGGWPEVECHWGINYADRAPKPAQPLFAPHQGWIPIVLKGR